MKKIYLLFGALIALSSCSESNVNIGKEPANDPTLIPITITNNVWSRVTDDAYEQGDKVGIYIVNYDGTTAGTLAVSGNHATNMPFEYNNSKWASDTDLYWKGKDVNADFYCYFPYDSAQSSVSAYAFSVNADQSTTAAYKASELLWGKATNITPTENAVPITTNHSMSNVIVKLAAGKGYTADSFAAESKEVSICNTKLSSTINLATGAVSATGNVSTITPLNEGEQYRALVVPQSINDVPFVKVVINDIEYILKATYTFEGGKQHTCTVTIDKTAGGVNIGIGGWETDDNDFGGTAE